MISFTSLNCWAEVKTPTGNQFFADEKLIQEFKLPGGELRSFRTDKDFEELKLEVLKTLGKGWVAIVPEEERPLDDELSKKLSLKKILIFTHAEAPKLRVSLTLVDLSSEAGVNSIATLTILRKYKLDK